MTREDVVNSYGYKVAKASVDYSQKYAKDDELQGIVIDTFEDAAKFGYNLAIEKACEWLNENMNDVGIRFMRGDEIKDIVDLFRKAMKGGDE